MSCRARHIAHRCHKKEFQLESGKGRQGWLDSRFETEQWYGNVILNYMAGCRHIRLHIHQRHGGDIIQKRVPLPPLLFMLKRSRAKTTYRM
jgi:hypothetical protein